VSRLGVFVGEQGNWSFFRDIFEDLRAHHQVSVYTPKRYSLPLLQGRLNRWAHFHGIESLLRRSDLAFFEWASELLEPASHMRKRCPIVTRLHSYELYAWGPRINWNNVDRVILVSEAMRRNFAVEFPEHAAKAVTVPNAVALDVFTPPEARDGSLNLGMLCSFFPRKRIYEVILMFSKLAARHPSARLHLGGGRVHAPDHDEYYLACRRLVTRLGLEHAVIFYDRVDQTAAWLRQIDVFISNSYWEGQQVALLEAMAAGCYCLSHRWDGAEEVLPEKALHAGDDELLQHILEYAGLAAAGKRVLHEEMRRLACERFDGARQRGRLRRIIDSILTTKGDAPEPAAASSAARLRG